MPITADIEVEKSSIYPPGANLGTHDFVALPRIGEDIELDIVGGQVAVTGIVHHPVLAGTGLQPIVTIYVDTH
jgi:hypothetical protein